MASLPDTSPVGATARAEEPGAVVPLLQAIGRLRRGGIVHGDALRSYVAPTWSMLRPLGLLGGTAVSAMAGPVLDLTWL